MATKKTMTREHLIRAAKRAAKQVDGTLTLPLFQAITGIGHSPVYQLFTDGGWTELKRQAGLAPPENKRVSDEQLLQEFHRVTAEFGRLPTWDMLSSRTTYSRSVYHRRFKGMPGTVERYLSWLEEHDPASPLLDELRPNSKNTISLASSRICHASAEFQWKKIEGPEFGAPVDLLGLRYAPINENGVIYVFGKVSHKLGFIVEAIHTAYPDCIAKRCTDKRRNRWQHVRIEFEYQSKHFQKQEHDPQKCDLIICWEHNWPDCPLEVLELKTLIDGLME